MKRLLISLSFVVILGLFAAWWFSDKQVLKRRTHSLLETLTFDAGTSRTTRQLGGYTFNGLLAPEVELINPTINEANGSFERTELESGYSWLAAQAKQSKFEAKEIQSIEINGKRAILTLTLSGMVELANYRPADGNFRVIFYWTKSDDGWRLTKADWKPQP